MYEPAAAAWAWGGCPTLLVLATSRSLCIEIAAFAKKGVQMSNIYKCKISQICLNVKYM